MVPTVILWGAPPIGLEPKKHQGLQEAGETLEVFRTRGKWVVRRLLSYKENKQINKGTDR